MALNGKQVALAEGRQLEELARLLQAEGALVLRCPMISILDAPDPKPVQAWIRELCDGRFSHVILLTGEGLRHLVAEAEEQGMRAEMLAALARTRIVVRGPKPVQALREIGLKPTLIASTPTTDGVIATLRQESLAGQKVGVQLYSESNPPLTEFLAAAGAEAHTVQPYIYAPAADAERIMELIDRLVAGAIDAVLFTSSPQVDRLFEVAQEKGRLPDLERGLNQTCVAAVGPVVADALMARHIKVAVMPPQGFQMKNLVQNLKRHFAER